MGQAHEFTTVQGCKSDKGFTGYLTGTASSASKWVYARTITLTGSVTGSVSIDGSGDVSLATTTNHTHNYLPLSGGTMSNTNKVTNLNADLLDGYHASSFSLTSHTHSYIVTQGDHRSTATKPSDYINRITFAGLKNNSVVGKPSSTTYNYIVGLRGWSDTSGGKAHELAFNDNGIFHRIGATDTWEAWAMMLTTSNYNSYAPTLTGTGAKGTWGINISGNSGSANALKLEAIGDLNSVTDNRAFYSYFQALNRPSSNYATGILLKNSALGHKYQLVFDADGGLFTRHYTSSWQPWKTIAFTDSDISGNAATATNADLLDGWHRNDILRITHGPTSVISLNDVVMSGIDFTSWAYAHSANVNNQPNGNGASSAACVVSFGTSYPFQIYSDYNDTSYLYYRSYYGGNGWKAWRQFAFIDSNVASATKLKNSRTI